MTGDAWVRIMNAMYPGHSCHVCDGTGWVLDSNGGRIPADMRPHRVKECPHCRRYGHDSGGTPGLYIRRRTDLNRPRRTR